MRHVLFEDIKRKETGESWTLIPQASIPTLTSMKKSQSLIKDFKHLGALLDFCTTTQKRFPKSVLYFAFLSFNSKIKEYNQNQQLSCTENAFLRNTGHQESETPRLPFESKCASPHGNTFWRNTTVSYLFFAFCFFFFPSVVILRQRLSTTDFDSSAFFPVNEIRH